MARRSLPAYEVLWTRHVSIYMDVFSLALKELSDRASVAGDEDAISESLCPILSRVCFAMNFNGEGEIRTPAWEHPRQPVTEEECTGGKLGKRPDFTCSCYNRLAVRADEMEIPFHVECKLLGSPTSPSWNLNKNYVFNGMARFDSLDHNYGKRASSGLMIGYIISLSPERISDEVNTHKKQRLGSWPDVKFTWRSGHIHQTDQIINRQHVIPQEFVLIHIWADMRHSYAQCK